MSNRAAVGYMPCVMVTRKKVYRYSGVQFEDIHKSPVVLLVSGLYDFIKVELCVIQGTHSASGIEDRPPSIISVQQE